jgi:uncharacterized protein YijF (DUF1287 family)
MRRRDLLWASVLAFSPPFAGAQGPSSATAQLPFGVTVARAAEARARKPEIYDGAYRVIAYPMGDVPDDRGVCTDTVIRAFRTGDVDLQQLVHEDMRRAFAAYPKTWGLKRPDRNIDHRRVPNLEVFFTRQGKALTRSRRASEYLPGDLVSWRLTGTNLPHIGVVSTQTSALTHQPLIAHNIGAGTQIEDCLFAWPMTGRFRWA